MLRNEYHTKVQVISIYKNKWKLKNLSYSQKLPQLNTNYDDYILQLDGAPPPNFHRNVRVFLNRVLQQRWIGRAAKGDNHLLPWPPRSPDLTPCDFFLWGFVRQCLCTTIAHVPQGTS